MLRVGAWPYGRIFDTLGNGDDREGVLGGPSGVVSAAPPCAILLEDIVTESVCLGSLQYEYCYVYLRIRKVGGQFLGDLQPR